MNATIEKIKALSIEEVIGKYIDLKKKGAQYVGLSPWSNEKTPSLQISPGKGIFKDFSSGYGGDAINFVRFHERLDFMGAVKDIARKFNIQYEEREYTPEEVKENKLKQSFRVIHQQAAVFYHQNIYKENFALSYEYLKSRNFSNEIIDAWQLGYAPNAWNDFEEYATKNGINKNLLIDSTLVKQNDNNKTYDYFRNRVMFPICNDYGDIIAFGGRWLQTGKETGKKQPKYVNTPTTSIYDKSLTLFGFHKARKSISDKDGSYLVEGYTDVIRMHSIGIENTVASCGTALTIEQVKKLNKISHNITLIRDGDKAGLKAIHRDADIIISMGMNCNVIALPDKEDPDSFFTSTEIFKGYKKAHRINYIYYLAQEESKKISGMPDRKAALVEKICRLLMSYKSKTQVVLYIKELAKIVPDTTERFWNNTLKGLLKEEEDGDKISKIPKEVSAADVDKYGFYEYKNCYHFLTQKGWILGSNFTLKPLFHVESVLNAKRIYEIRNEFGYTRVIELAQADLVSLSKFKLRVESLGNFIWYASETELNKLKGYIYEKTETCTEIVQLGWQKAGFFAWGNGIFNGKYTQVDDYGIVSHKDKNYYIPAFSKIFEVEEGLYHSERRFVHVDSGKISFHDYAEKLINVFDTNAAIGLCFYFACIFRDIIFNKFRFFPILNIFGPKGTGKSGLAIALSHFFGKPDPAPNINNTSKPALADHMAFASNTLMHIEEYKNSVDYEKIEFLKGLWDGTGRTRMNMDKDKKKETTKVDSGLVLTGQEMPTADIALFSRLIFLTFTNTEFSDEEKERYKDLQETYEKGITHLTEEVLTHREYFKENYNKAYKDVCDDIKSKLGRVIIEDRIFKNWSCILAALKTLEWKISLPFNYKVILDASIQLIIRQNIETKKSNEISGFWDIVEYLVRDGLIEHETDFRFDDLITIKTDLIKDAVWTPPKRVLYLLHSRVIPLYRKHGKQMDENILPVKTLEYYLQNDKSYLGKKRVAFKGKKQIVEVIGKDNIRSNEEKQTRNVTNAYCFDYEMLDINIHNEIDENEDVF